ncbi:glycoside hydrolase family 88 protein [Parasediminibacterium sp. JCM 36343]|uniref:glycoside hydrolase family 88 protein n=1 Tax=Parasediminibacterium sp. JCM 36343 TaxID=3374279 RepID=UPI00397AC7DF
MIKKIISISVCLLLLMTISVKAQESVNLQKAFKQAEIQYLGMLKSHPDLTKFPQSSNADGTPRDMPPKWWCSGFFPGSLWYLYEFTKDTTWGNEANKWTMALENEQYNSSDHDLGFKLYCSFGNGYRLTKNEAYKNIMLTGAKSLASRYDPKVGLIKSWNSFQKIYNYPVIIDNMMNLEFLLWAAKASGNKTYYNICISHADKTLKNHFRKDNSSYHVVCYDSVGNAIAKKTHQGTNDSSAWARGQTWGLYGFTVMYRETKKTEYLQKARSIADFYLNHPNLPKDKVPYWDFNAPGIPNAPRDASAAAVAASGLIELSTYLGKDGNKYFDAAEKMLVSLTNEPYLAKVGSNNHFILTQCVGNYPEHSEINTPLVYADYYFLEALLRYQKIKNKRKSKI